MYLLYIWLVNLPFITLILFHMPHVFLPPHEAYSELMYVPCLSLQKRHGGLTGISIWTPKSCHGVDLSTNIISKRIVFSE